jgi:hypothetical protein
MQRITVKGITWRIRGPSSPRQLRTQYKAFITKYPSSKLTLAQWLVNNGKVYFKEKQ